MNKEEIKIKIKELGKWYQRIELEDGIATPGRKDSGDTAWQEMVTIVPELLSGGLSVLDIGCDAGCYALRAAIAGADVVAVDKRDFHIAQTEFLKSYFQDRLGKDLNVNFIEHHIQFTADACSLDSVLPGRTFDIVLLSSVVYHMKPVDRVAEHFSRIAKKKIVARFSSVRPYREGFVFTEHMERLGWKVTFNGKNKGKSRRYFIVYEKV